jgi:hypothetical protein
VSIENLTGRDRPPGGSDPLRAQLSDLSGRLADAQEELLQATTGTRELAERVGELSAENAEFWREIQGARAALSSELAGDRLR